MVLWCYSMWGVQGLVYNLYHDVNGVCLGCQFGPYYSYGTRVVFVTWASLIRAHWCENVVSSEPKIRHRSCGGEVCVKHVGYVGEWA